MVNVERVEALVSAALEGMATIPDTTAVEVTSAGFTLCARLISVTMESTDEAGRMLLRDAVLQLLLRCADPAKVN